MLNIQQNTPQNLLPDFDYSDVLLDIVVGRQMLQDEQMGEASRRGRESFVSVYLERRCLASI